MIKQNPIICAVDTTSVDEAKLLAGQIGDHVGALKLGLEFFTANGSAGVKDVSAGRFPIFLDLKFHDIPNTVSGAIKATAGIDTFMITIHTQGGMAMMKAAADAADYVSQATGKGRPLIVGVTVLTSLDQNDIASMGVSSKVEDQVKRLADLAKTSGLDGVVCSPMEIAMLRKHCGNDFVIVTPGIRPAGSDAGDQKRIMTPKEAIDAGADYLVIGRPITAASDPKAAAASIVASL